MGSQSIQCNGFLTRPHRADPRLGETGMPSRKLQKSDFSKTGTFGQHGRRILVSNRKARHDYEVIDTIETGIELRGSEVKSLREGKGSLQDSFAVIRRGELFLKNAHIPRYSHTSDKAVDERRDRKLLAHKKEIRQLLGKVAQAGLTLVPLQMYLDHGLVKVELALARGRRKYDKRAMLKEREHKREIERVTKSRNRIGGA